MNKKAVTAITALLFSFSAFAQEGKSWTEEEWKNDKGRQGYGWVFPHIDKNADGKITAAEYEAFQKYKTERPNWEVELNPNAKPAKKAPASGKGGPGSPAKTNEDIPQGIEALEASLNKERMAQAVEMFEKLDKNKDGKITVPEVPAKQFENKTWKVANLNGDMTLTWEEELIWQYNFQKKKAKKK